MTCRKRPYKTVDSCWRVIRLMVKSKAANRGDLEPYKCRKCSSGDNKVFHVGHKKHTERISPKTWESIKGTY